MITIFKRGSVFKGTIGSEKIDAEGNTFPLISLPVNETGSPTELNDFQWWDHAFNKAAQAFDIKVTDDKGAIVEKTNAIGKIKTKKGNSNLDQNNCTL